MDSAAESDNTDSETKLGDILTTTKSSLLAYNCTTTTNNYCLLLIPNSRLKNAPHPLKILTINASTCQ